MNGIEKITAKIMEDAQLEIEQMNRETEEQIHLIGNEAQLQADREVQDILEKGRRAAGERLERLKSAAQMERRKLILGAKQEVVGEAFELALDKLSALPEETYIQILTRLVLEASSTGKERLIFSAKDRSRVGKQVVVAVNETLSRKGKTGLLTLAEESREIRGGFVMVDGDVEINCAFETLVRLQRESLEKEVAHTLFK